jgi:hypothetical protein
VFRKGRPAPRVTPTVLLTGLTQMRNVIPHAIPEVIAVAKPGSDRLGVASSPAMPAPRLAPGRP